MPEVSSDPKGDPLIILSPRSMSENLTGNWRTLRPAIDAARCTGCLLCWKFCPEACVALTAKVPRIDFSYCKGCGICVEECPPKCISFDREEAA